MSLDPELKCQYCGSSDLYEEKYYDDEEFQDIDVFCNKCNRRVQ